IVPDITIGLSSPIFSTPVSPHNAAAAVDNAASHLGPGDVLVIEQHYRASTPPGAVCNTGCGDPCGGLLSGSEFGYLPAAAVQAGLDAIRRATAMGIVVVEAAGNGQMNLDDPFYAGRFDRTIRDSGAILVGAGRSANAVATSRRSAWCFSNFGSR